MPYKFTLLPCLLSLATHAALADTQELPATQLEGITLSADFWPTTQQNNPVSATIIDEFSIEEKGALHMQSLVSQVPNMTMAGGSNRARFFQIRGIGERSQFQAPVHPSVGLLVDDIDLSGLGGAGMLFDVQQMEVLRGPQGTRFGANALAGIVSLYSPAPANSTQGYAVTGIGNRGRQRLGAAITGPLGKQLSGRMAVQHAQSDGDIHNATLDRDDTNQTDELTARAKLRWIASEQHTVDTTLLHLRNNNGYDAFSLDNSRTTLSDQPGEDDLTLTAISVKSRLLINSGQTLETVLSHAAFDSVYSYDEDWVYEGFHEYGYNSFDEYLRDGTRTSVDIRLQSAASEEKLITSRWAIGAYTSRNDENLTRNYTYAAGPFDSDYQTTSLAMYGQIQKTVSAGSAVFAGARIERWAAQYQDSELSDVRNDETLLGGKLGILHQLRDNHILTATLSRGFKPGGVNIEGTLPQNLRSYDTEYLLNYELSLNSVWNKNLQSRLTAFHSQRQQQQLKGSYQVAHDDGSTEWLDYTDNADAGTQNGLELEINQRLSARAEMQWSLGLLQTEIHDYTAPATQADPEGVALDGREQAYAPSWQYGLTGVYLLSDDWTLQASIEGSDAFYFSDRHNAKSDAYTLLGGSIAYQPGDWRFTLWGRNLGNADYAIRGFGSFGNDPRNDYAPGVYTQKGEARAFGVTARFDF